MTDLEKANVLLEKLNNQPIYILEENLEDDNKKVKRKEKIRIAGILKRNKNIYVLYDYSNLIDGDNVLGFCYKELAVFLKEKEAAEKLINQNNIY